MTLKIPGIPPEISEGAEAEAEKLWALLEKDIPAIDQSLKPRVIQVLVIAYCRGTVRQIEIAMDEAIEKISAMKRRPTN